MGIPLVLRGILAALLTGRSIVLGFSTGAGGCRAGFAAVSSTHLDDNGGRGVEEGTLADAFVTVSIGGVKMTTEETINVPIDTDLVIAVDSPDVAYLGVLIRLQAPDGTDTTTALLPAANTKDADVCASPVVGITHTNSEQKTLSTGTIRFDEAVQNILLDVTVVFQNNAEGSIYAYDRLRANFVERAVTSPPTQSSIETTGAPTRTIPADTTQVPTVQPTTLTPTTTPQTGAPTRTNPAGTTQAPSVQENTATTKTAEPARSPTNSPSKSSSTGSPVTDVPSSAPLPLLTMDISPSMDSIMSRLTQAPSSTPPLINDAEFTATPSTTYTAVVNLVAADATDRPTNINMMMHGEGKMMKRTGMMMGGRGMMVGGIKKGMMKKGMSKGKRGQHKRFRTWESEQEGFFRPSRWTKPGRKSMRTSRFHFPRKQNRPTRGM